MESASEGRIHTGPFLAGLDRGPTKSIGAPLTVQRCEEFWLAAAGTADQRASD